AEPAPQIKTCLAHLTNDLGDVHLRREVVAGDRNRYAARVEPARQVAEGRRLERTPIAAVNEQRERRGGGTGRRKQIDRLPRCRAVADAQFGAPYCGCLVAVGRRLGNPSGEDLRMFRHPDADVVFDLVIDSHAALTSGSKAALEDLVVSLDSEVRLRWANFG